MRRNITSRTAVIVAYAQTGGRVEYKDTFGKTIRSLHLSFKRIEYIVGFLGESILIPFDWVDVSDNLGIVTGTP